MPDTKLNARMVFAAAPLAGKTVIAGVGRYGTPFIPAVAAFPNRGNAVSGVVRDGAGVPCARTVRLYDRETGVLIAETASNASTGAYSFNIGAGEVQRIVLDDSGGTLYNDLIDRVIPA